MDTDKTNDKPTPNTVNGQVMDIQSPPSAQPQPTPTLPPQSWSAAPVATPVAEDPVVAIPETITTVQPVEPEKSVADVQTMAPATEVVEAPNDDDVFTDKSLETPVSIKKSGPPMAVIAIAVFVGLTLAGLAVFMYLKSNPSTKSSADASKTSNSQGIAPKPAASVSDVDDTNQQIDTTLTKVDDTKDFSGTELSDSALGL